MQKAKAVGLGLGEMVSDLPVEQQRCWVQYAPYGYDNRIGGSGEKRLTLLRGSLSANPAVRVSPLLGQQNGGYLPFDRESH